jgi:hypothetical protein
MNQISDKDYYGNWPSKCPYNDDLNWASAIGIKYLSGIAPVLKKQNKIGIVILDIDDTIVMGDPADVIGIKEMELGSRADQEIFILPVNNQIVQLANHAKALGFKIIALTSRPTTSRLASITNLNMFRVPYDHVIMNDRSDDHFFKIRIRRSLEKPNQTVVLTVGDSPCDCIFPVKAASIKLPDPRSKCSYAYIP